MSTPQLSAGTVVDGTYTITAVLRMRPGATTYEATDASGAHVAVTVYDAGCFPSSLVLERCLRELRQLQSVASDRIAPVLACGKHGDGIYEVNAPMPPHTLEEHLHNGALPLQDAGAIIVQVGEALLEAQRVGVVHRNLGANVVFPSPEGVKLIGFAVGEPHGEQSFGPLHTLAPEQVEGKVVDQRTLIYNLAALMHWMMTGRPLFEGDPAAVLQQHLQGDPPPNVHGSLARALGKDPRMRPMILKQFLVELAAVGGVQPPKVPVGPVTKTPRPAAQPTSTPAAPPAASAKPSSRGWTMFMQAQEEDVGAPAPAAPAPVPAAPAPVAAPAPAPAPASASAASQPAKPSTRGWTMFMEAQDDAAAPSEASVPEPAAAPVQAPASAAPAKPSTRGWTMFMEADEAAPAEAAQPAAQQPAAQQPAAQQPAAQQPAAPAKPSTRGWTMFMEAQDEGEPAASPAATPAEPAQPEQPVAAAPAKPSTRGWTMFMEAQDEAPAATDAPVPSPATPTAPVAAAPAPAMPEAVAPASATSPSSRGWTMFMEPGAEAATPASTPAPVDPPAVEAAAPVEPDAPTSTKRGWTMFMDAPIAEAKKAAGVGSAASEPAVDGASDNKGWTVFGAPADAVKAVAAAPEVAANPAPSKVGRGQTVVVDGYQPAPPPEPSAHAPQHVPHVGSGPLAPGARPAPPPGLTMPTDYGDGAMTETTSGSKLPLIIILVVVIAALVGGAFVFLK